jgi:type IV secretory pathway protease TraF
VNGLLFADDLVIFARTQRGLRERLKLLKKFTDSKKLTVNTSKCEIVPFGALLGSSFKFSLGGQPIPVVRRCKYLGIYFDQVNLLEAHAEQLY